MDTMRLFRRVQEFLTPVTVFVLAAVFFVAASVWAKFYQYFANSSVGTVASNCARCPTQGLGHLYKMGEV